MLNGDTSPSPCRVGILLLPDFPLMAYASIVEVLRGANALSEKRLFEILSISTGGEKVSASSGIEVVINETIDSRASYDIVIVCAGNNAIQFQDKHTFAWIRSLHSRGVRIGAASVGAIVLARSGIIGRRKCTIHWGHRDRFREEFPEINLTAGIYVIEDSIVTCAGGTASFDLMCELIKDMHGRALAGAIREWFLHVPSRLSDDAQRSSLRDRTGVNHPKLLRALELMEGSLEFPKSRKAVADALNISTRHLDRLFSTHIAEGFSHRYLKLRLDQACNMLLQTDMPIIDIALSCGFASASAFSKNFKTVLGESPSVFRSKRWKQTSDTRADSYWSPP